MKVIILLPLCQLTLPRNNHLRTSTTARLQQFYSSVYQSLLHELNGTAEMGSRAEQTVLFHNLEERKIVLPAWSLNTSPISSFPLSCPPPRSYLYMFTYSFQKFFGNLFSYSLLMSLVMRNWYRLGVILQNELAYILLVLSKM